MIDDGFDPVVARSQGVNDRLRFGVGGQRYGEIRIAGEARFRAHRDREAADNRERDASLGKVAVDPAEGGAMATTKRY